MTRHNRQYRMEIWLYDRRSGRCLKCIRVLKFTYRDRYLAAVRAHVTAMRRTGSVAMVCATPEHGPELFCFA